MCLYFDSGEPMLDGYTDLDITRDIDFRKSTLGS